MIPTTKRQLTLCEYNVENLFVSMAYYQGENFERLTEEGWRYLALAQHRQRQKPLSKLWGLAQTMLDIDADIFLLAEVGGLESLENFNRHFLHDRYEAYLLEGNSQRGIELGFLVRKGLGLRAEPRSNRDTPVEVTAWKGKHLARFSRDAAELRLHDESGLRLILLLLHLKSKLGSEGDVLGKDQRTAEAIALSELYQGLRRDHPETPIVVGGDFNADLSSLELELVRHTDLADFHDLLETPPEHRTTYVHFDTTGKAQHLVLDYLLVSPQLRDRIQKDRSFTYRYKTFHDIPEALPTSLKQRYRLPSDHYPVVLTFTLPEARGARPSAPRG